MLGEAPIGVIVYHGICKLAEAPFMVVPGLKSSVDWTWCCNDFCMSHHVKVFHSDLYFARAVILCLVDSQKGPFLQ